MMEPTYVLKPGFEYVIVYEHNTTTQSLEIRRVGRSHVYGRGVQQILSISCTYKYLIFKDQISTLTAPVSIIIFLLIVLVYIVMTP